MHQRQACQAARNRASYATRCGRDVTGLMVQRKDDEASAMTPECAQAMSPCSGSPTDPGSHSVKATLAGPDPQHAVHGADPDLPVANGAGIDGLGDRVSHEPSDLVLDHNVDA